MKNYYVYATIGEVTHKYAMYSYPLMGSISNNRTGLVGSDLHRATCISGKKELQLLQ